MLWINVDTDKTQVDLIVSISHELQHAVEILRDSNVRDSHHMFLFYSRVGRRGPDKLPSKRQQPSIRGTQ